MKSNREAQNLTKVVHDEARRILLRHISKTVGDLDALYEKDAERLKKELRAIFKHSGIPQRRATRLVDEVLASSRADRVKVVEKGIMDAVESSKGLDKRTFKVVFGGEKETPLAKGRSGSQPNRTPSRSPASESEDEPA